jgi:hypothetical protein
VIQFQTPSTVSNYMPDEVLGDAGSPGSSMPTDGSEDPSGSHRRSCSPPVDSTLNPSRHRDRANVIALADKIRNCPMSLPNLDVFFSQ